MRIKSRTTHTAGSEALSPTNPLEFSLADITLSLSLMILLQAHRQHAGAA